MTNFTNTKGLSTCKFSVNQTNSTIILEDNATATLPNGVTFQPDFAPGMGNTGKITVTEVAPPTGSITLFNETITHVIPGRRTIFDFSFIDTTQTNKNDISIVIDTTPTKGTFNKTTYNYYEFGKYLVNSNATGNETIQWYLNTPNGNTNMASITFEFDNTVPQNNAVIQTRFTSRSRK